jgi:membrane-associated phospholipid phosphatase
MTDAAPSSGSASAAAPRQTGSHPLGVTGNLLIALGGFVLVTICALIARDGTVGSLERDVFHAINDLPEWLYRVFWPFQQFGNLVVALVVGLVVALCLRKWWVALAVVAAVALKLLCESLVKEIVQRSRPGTSIGDITMRGDVSVSGLSFVSGHAVIVTAIAGLLTPILPRAWKWVPWVFVAMNGIARIYVGAHNPLDIIGGVGVGLVIAGILNALLAPTRVQHEEAISS